MAFRRIIQLFSLLSIAILMACDADNSETRSQQAPQVSTTQAATEEPAAPSTFLSQDNHKAPTEETKRMADLLNSSGKVNQQFADKMVTTSRKNIGNE